MGNERPYGFTDFADGILITKEGPHGSIGFGTLFPTSCGSLAAELANIAYAEGYKAGRASREGLRDALGVLGQNLGSEVLNFGTILASKKRVIDFIAEALAEDDKESVNGK